MKIGDLVEIPCTCGKSTNLQPKIGVVINKCEDSNLVQILLEGRPVWVDPDQDIRLFNESR